MTLKEILMQKLRDNVPANILSKIPSRFPVIGRAMIIRLHPDLMPYGEEIGNMILENINNIDSVWAILKTGRVIRKPRVIHLAGKKNPIVIHRELNTLFRIDITRITFSPGNQTERKKLLKLVGDEEVVVDMFACVGNLSLPIAVNKAPRIVYCIEINPYAYRFLVENIALNKVEHKVVPILGNNLLFKKEDIADHIIMGYLPEPQSQIEVAVRVAKKSALIHYHTLVRRGYEKIKKEDVARNIENMGASVISASWEIVKSYSPAYNHMVIRLHIQK